MLYRDKSPRTTPVSKPTTIIIISLIVIVICSVFVVLGQLKYNDIVKKSSTPIGSNLTFPRSQSDVTLKNVYLDKSSDVMVIRLQSKDGAKLPYKGTDYKVYLNSKSLEGHKKADILFGRMSTDGDLFLVIPKPKDEVYSVFIMNQKYLGSSDEDESGAEYDDDESDNEDLSKQTEGVKKDDEEEDDSQTQQSISKALSSYQFDKDNPESSTTDMNSSTGSNYDDIIYFRVTKDPAFKTKQYQPTRLNVDLMNNKNEFDYEKFFDVAFKNAITKDLENKYDSLDKNMSNYKDQQSELENRIADNPDDEDAKQNLESIKESIDELKEQQDKISNQITEYSLLDYKDSYFKYMNKKATIVDKDEINEEN